MTLGYLLIKGPMAAAGLEAEKRGLRVIGARRVDSDSMESLVTIGWNRHAELTVAVWFCETTGQAPWPNLTMLHYRTAEVCPHCHKEDQS